MTPEAQRIAIAEACGAKWGHPVFKHDLKWHVHFAKEPFEFDSSWAGKPPPFDDCVKDLDIPDYLNDLNAMHEAEKVLTPEQSRTYALVLEELVCPDFLADTDCDPDSTLFAYIHSTAAQRAEAFLSTIGLWT